MASCLSPSPSGRRLSELLEEKQEPFVLDLHLLEKGCSSRLLDGYDTALCWPTAAGNDAAAAVLRRLTSKSSKAAAARKTKKPQQAGGLLRLLISKILRGSKAAPAPRKPAALQSSESFKIAAVAPAPPSPCRDGLAAVKTAADSTEQGTTESDCEYYSDDEKQQLSPVSVLGPHPFEMSMTSPAHGKVSPPSKHAIDVFRELLDAAYSPALLTQLLAKTDDLLLNDCAAAAVADEDDDYYYCYGSSTYRTSPKNCGDDESAAAYWDAHRAELARVSELVASEVPLSKLTAADVQRDRQDVGAEVEAAVFEALLMELVGDLGIGRC